MSIDCVSQRQYEFLLRSYEKLADKFTVLAGENVKLKKVAVSARPLFKFLENAGIYRYLTLPDLAVRPYNDLMTRLEEALAELEAVE